MSTGSTPPGRRLPPVRAGRQARQRGATWIGSYPLHAGTSGGEQACRTDDEHHDDEQERERGHVDELLLGKYRSQERVHEPDDEPPGGGSTEVVEAPQHHTHEGNDDEGEAEG